MQGLREGRVWVDHRCLIAAIDVTVSDQAKSVTLGEKLTTKRGRKVMVAVSIATASKPNLAGFVPELARVDVILGSVTGPAADKMGNAAPWEDLWFSTNPIFVEVAD